MSDSSLLSQLVAWLTMAMSVDERLLVMTADVGKSTGIAPLKDLFPDRYINVGIAEQDLVGMAAGLAAEGFIPFVFGYSTYVALRPFEQIRNLVGISSCRICLVGTHSGLSGYSPGDRSLEDIAVLKSVDNLQVFTPNFEDELKFAIQQAMQGPVFIRLLHRRYANDSSRIIGGSVAEGALRKVSGAADSAIVSFGLPFHLLMERHSEALDADVYSLFCQNVSASEIRRKLGKYKRIIVCQDHKVGGSIYFDIVEAFYRAAVRPEIYHISLPENYLSYGDPLKCLEHAGFIFSKLREKLVD